MPSFDASVVLTVRCTEAWKRAKGTMKVGLRNTITRFTLPGGNSTTGKTWPIGEM